MGRTIWAGAAAACLLSLSACSWLGNDDPTQPPTSGGDTSSEPGASHSPITSRAQEQHDLDPLMEALPDNGELPDPWRETRSGGSQASTKPESCEDMYFTGPAEQQFRDTSGSSIIASTYFTSSEDDSSITVILRSYEQPVPFSVLDAAGEALAQCSTFELVRTSGDQAEEPVTMRSAGLTGPDLGDRSFAISVTGESFGQQRLVVMSGHNLIYVVHEIDDSSPPDPSQTLYDVAQTVLDKLEKT